MFNEPQNRQPEIGWAGSASAPPVDPAATVPCASHRLRRARPRDPRTNPFACFPPRSISCVILLHKSAIVRISIDSRDGDC